MYSGPVIDADGHVLEKKNISASISKRPGISARRRCARAINLGMPICSIVSRWRCAGRTCRPSSRSTSGMRRWIARGWICDLLPDRVGKRLQKSDFALAIARASNTQFAKEFNAQSNRVSCVGVLPLRDPKAAAEELRRGVTELGLKGFEILPMGLPMALGSTFYDPVYAEAEKLGAVIGIHGSRSNSHESGADKLIDLCRSAFVRIYRRPVAAVYPCRLPGCAGSFPQFEIGLLGDRRHLAAVLFRPIG